MAAGTGPECDERGMNLKPGTRLRSQVDATEVIVVRSPVSAGVVGCGGHPMVGLDAEVVSALPPAGSGGEAAQLGKRYTAPQDEGLEVLVTKPGSAGLDFDGAALVVKQAKPLPASD
jgi:hypothetical protein